jgi:hypothetical protein
MSPRPFQQKEAVKEAAKVKVLRVIAWVAFFACLGAGLTGRSIAHCRDAHHNITPCRDANGNITGSEMPPETGSYAIIGAFIGLGMSYLWERHRPLTAKRKQPAP